MNEDRCDELGSRRHRFAVLMLSMMMVMACDGVGCDIDGFSEAPFPEEYYDNTVIGSAEVRISSHGLEFLADEVGNLVEEASDDGLSFCVPPTSQSGADLCHVDHDNTCDDDENVEHGCQLDLEISEAHLVPQSPNQVVAHLTIGGLHERLPFDYSLLSCWLDLYSDSGGEDEAASIDVVVPVSFEVDPQSELNDIQIEVGDVVVDLDDVAYSFSNRSGFGCAAAGWGVNTFLDGFLRDMLRDELDEIIEGFTDEELCRPCGQENLPCPSVAECDASGDEPLCIYPDGQCVPMLLGLEGVLELDELIGEFLPHDPADVYVTGRVADRVSADTGVTLAVRAGSQPDHKSTCVPLDAVERPSFDEIAESPSINADHKPDGTSFMFGFGMHRRTLQHLSWSIWASGGLCVEVGPQQSDLLTTGGFAPFIDSIDDIATRSGPLKIRMAPQQPPDIALGANEVVDGEVVDGLLHLEWDDLDIHMYGFVQERYARLFTLRVDLRLPIALVPDGDAAVLPVLGDFEDALQNMRLLNDDLLDEEVETFEEMIPVIIGLALPDLLDGLSDPIDLPEFLGYQVVIEEGDLAAVDDGDVLALFADLAYVGSDEAAAYMMAPRAVVAGERLEIEERDGAAPRVSMTLDLMAEQAGAMLPDEEVEYAYRLNKGFWRMAGAGATVNIDDPVLRLQGEHTLELRARQVGARGARWQSVPTSMNVLIDYQPPTVEAWQRGEILRVSAEDVVDDEEQMVMRHRYVVDDQPATWSNWQEIASIDLSHAPVSDDLAVDVEVRDRAGLSDRERVNIRRDTLKEQVAEETVESQPGGCGGCSAVGGGNAPIGGLLVLLAFFAVGRRRRMKIVMMATVVAFALSGCSGCSDDESTEQQEEENQEEEDDCPDGCDDDQVCIDGQCVVPAECEEASDCSDADCADHQFAICDGGDCACEDYCAEDCGDNAFCCYESHSCEQLPDPCAELNCDPGYETELQAGPEYESASCEITAGECECVTMAPIPLRYHGSYPSMDAGAGITAVSVHNLGYGDLMVGFIGDDKISGVDQWYFVDGVPEDGTVGGDPYGPRDGILTSGREVGTHTATAVDDDGRVHVFYRHENDDALKYARGEQSGDEWAFEITRVEDDEGDLDTGYFSVVRLRDDALHLFYTARLSDEESELRYRVIDVDHPVDAMADTDFEVLHAGVGEEDDSLEDYPRIAALFTQVVEDEDGEFFISFYDNTRQRAGWLSEGVLNEDEAEEDEPEEDEDEPAEDAGPWGAPTFLDGEGGPYTSARIDADRGVHVVFMDQSIPALIYQDAEGEREYVIDGIRDHDWGYSEMPVGHDVQLFVDGDGIDLLYHDASTHELRRAIRDDDGSWDISTLAGAAGEESPARGMYVRALSVDGQRLVVDFSVDTTGDDATGQPLFRIID